ncbi:MAG: phosphatase PAP2 family protein [Agathobacter sp.]|nr:phosphatase PAP2 family protein [Agathobacter sp.]
MKKETYIKMTQPFRDNTKRTESVHRISRILTGTVFFSYPILVIGLYLLKDPRVYRAVLVPAISFLLVTAFRYFVNRKRPYEVFELEPVIPKDTKGKSMPSRHTFSACIIGLTFLFCSPWWGIGIFLLIISFAIGILRIICGIHYISDVVVAVVVATVVAYIGYIR